MGRRDKLRKEAIRSGQVPSMRITALRLTKELCRLCGASAEGFGYKGTEPKGEPYCLICGHGALKAGDICRFSGPFETFGNMTGLTLREAEALNTLSRFHCPVCQQPDAAWGNPTTAQG